MAASVGSGAKTQQDPPVSHLHAQQDPVGFDFLGFNRSSIPGGQVPYGTNSRGTPWLSRPHQTRKRKVQLHCTAGDSSAMAGTDAGRPGSGGSTHHSRVEQLLPDRGQCKLRALRPPTLQVLRRWGNRRHPNKGGTGWCRNTGTSRLDLCGPRGTSLRKHQQLGLSTRQGARQSKSYDGDWVTGQDAWDATLG